MRAPGPNATFPQNVAFGGKVAFETGGARGRERHPSWERGGPLASRKARRHQPVPGAHLGERPPHRARRRPRRRSRRAAWRPTSRRVDRVPRGQARGPSSRPLADVGERSAPRMDGGPPAIGTPSACRCARHSDLIAVAGGRTGARVVSDLHGLCVLPVSFASGAVHESRDRRLAPSNVVPEDSQRRALGAPPERWPSGLRRTLGKRVY